MAGWSWILKHFPRESLPDLTSAAVLMPNPSIAPAIQTTTAPSEADISNGWNLPPSDAEKPSESSANAACPADSAERLPSQGEAGADAQSETGLIATSEAVATDAVSASDRVPLARLRRHLVVVSGGLVKRTEPSVFTDWVTARLSLSETHPLLGLLLVSFSSEVDARVQWRLAVGPEPNAAVLGRPVPCKVAARKPRSLTVYGVTAGQSHLPR